MATIIPAILAKDITDFEADWVLVRKFITSEPIHDIWGEEEEEEGGGFSVNVFDEGSGLDSLNTLISLPYVNDVGTVVEDIEGITESNINENGIGAEGILIGTEIVNLEDSVSGVDVIYVMGVISLEDIGACVDDILPIDIGMYAFDFGSGLETLTLAVLSSSFGIESFLFFKIGSNLILDLTTGKLKVYV